MVIKKTGLQRKYVSLVYFDYTVYEENQGHFLAHHRQDDKCQLSISLVLFFVLCVLLKESGERCKVTKFAACSIVPYPY